MIPAAPAVDPSGVGLGSSASGLRRRAADSRNGEKEPLGVRVAGPVEELVGRCLLDQLPALHHGDPIGHVAQDEKVVGDEELARLVRRGAAERIERRGRFLEGERNAASPQRSERPTSRSLVREVVALVREEREFAPIRRRTRGGLGAPWPTSSCRSRSLWQGRSSPRDAVRRKGRARRGQTSAGCESGHRAGGWRTASPRRPVASLENRQEEPDGHEYGGKDHGQRSLRILGLVATEYGARHP
jgi:hypothetical protein